MDLIERYKHGSKIEIAVGQKCKYFYEERGKEYFADGVIVAVYDTHFEAKVSTGGRILTRFDDPEQLKQIQLLTKDGKPVIARKLFVWFGGYKL